VDLHNAQKATSKIRESQIMKNLLVLFALLLIVGCAGNLASFSGSMDNRVLSVSMREMMTWA
jgi:hypothetical protein